MKHRIAALLSSIVLAGCGGGGPSSNEPPPRAAAPTTAAGSLQGEAVSRVIGAQGGRIESADGTLSVEVPAGAFSADTTVSIQQISTEAAALGAIGKAFRIQPEGLQSALPMTLRFHADDSTLGGTALRFVNVGYQDAAGRWRVMPTPQRDDNAKTVAVQTRHFSDWSMLTGVQLLPATATVKTGASVALQVRRCHNESVPGADDPDGVLLPVQHECTSVKDVTYGQGNWSVNGVSGGSEAAGTVVPNADTTTNQATYTAPTAVPQANPVAVSVEVLDPDNPSERTTLVSHLNVVPELSCTVLKGVEHIAANVAFDAYHWAARTDSESYEGNHSGHMAGVMKNLIPVPARELSPKGIWSSQNAEHTGLVTMNDTRKLFYPDETVVETAVASAAPFTGMEVPSAVTLTVDYATCTYELVATFVVLGDATSGSTSIETPLVPGGIYYRGTLPADFFLNGIVHVGSLPARYEIDEKRNGYYPAGQTAELRAQGSTTARWDLQIAP